MRKVFWDNPYQQTLTTKVASVDGDHILCEETIIYHFSGAQESDKATINSLPVLSSRMDGPLIYYTLPPEHTVKSGDTVTMEIDWPRRKRLMRLHFAAELVLELITRKLHLKKVGAHIAEAKARIDFESAESIAPFLPEISAQFHEVVANDLPIHKDFSDVEHQRRYWKIEGFAEVPCGGTHVKSTGEVGKVTLKRDRPGKGVERVEIRLVDDSPDHIKN